MVVKAFTQKFQEYQCWRGLPHQARHLVDMWVPDLVPRRYLTDTRWQEGIPSFES